jgi:hypothetical protein
MRHLADSERNVSEDARGVERQRLHVAELHKRNANKSEIDKAFSEMITLEERLSLHERDRDWFAEALKTYSG